MDPIKEIFNEALNEGRIFEASRFAKSIKVPAPDGATEGFLSRVVLSRGLFAHLYPWAEDGTKGKTFSGRLEPVLRKFSSAARFATKDFVEFDYTFDTYVRHAKNKDEISTWRDGKARDKTVHIFAMGIYCEKGVKCLYLGTDTKEIEE